MLSAEKSMASDGFDCPSFATFIPLPRKIHQRCPVCPTTRSCLAANAERRKKYTARRVPDLPSNARLVSAISIGDEFLGRVCEVGPADSSWIDIGVYTQQGRPVRGRLRFVKNRKGYIRKEVTGAVVPVYVHKVNREAGRIEVRRGPKKEPNVAISGDVLMLDDLQVGQRLEGSVTAVGDYGAVVDANVYRIGKHGQLVPKQGLLPRRYFRNKWSSAADKVIKGDAETIIDVGDSLEVWIRAAQVANSFLVFDSNDVSRADVEQDRKHQKSSVRRRQRKASVDSLQAGEMRDGVVTDIVPYGAFVDVGVKWNGLIHSSKMGENYRKNWREVVTAGAAVTVEVVVVEKKKISLQLHAVKEIMLQEVRDAARSPLARSTDVELASALNVAAEQKRGKRVSLPDGSDHQVKKKVAEVEADFEERPPDDENSLSDEADGDEPDKFSDEYFEEKYGY